MNPNDAVAVNTGEARAKDLLRTLLMALLGSTAKRPT